MEQDRYFLDGLHIDRYRILEDDLLKFLYYMPLDFYPTADARSHIASPYLADMLIRVGSAIDTFFRKFIMAHQGLIKDLEIEIEFKPEEKYKWDDYRKLGSKLKFSQCNVGLNQIIYGTNSLYPFNGEGKSSNSVEWNDSDLNYDKFWWGCYNKVKHNGAFEKANLENVMQALGAYIILISYQPHKKLLLYNYITIRDDDSRWIGPCIKTKLFHVYNNYLGPKSSLWLENFYNFTFGFPRINPNFLNIPSQKKYLGRFYKER